MTRPSDEDAEIDGIVEWLRDPDSSEPCAEFPRDVERASHAGLYAWHGDDVALDVVRDVLGAPAINPLYAGQAGAESSVVGKPSGATLASRIRSNHIRGNTRVSTFRRTWAALLWDQLGLNCTRPRTLDPEGNIRLTAWMIEHLRVAMVPLDDRARLGVIEGQVLASLDPPLNLNKVASTDSRRRLRDLRRQHLGS